MPLFTSSTLFILHPASFFLLVSLSKLSPEYVLATSHVMLVISNSNSDAEMLEPTSTVAHSETFPKNREKTLSKKMEHIRTFYGDSGNSLMPKEKPATHTSDPTEGGGSDTGKALKTEHTPSEQEVTYKTVNHQRKATRKSRAPHGSPQKNQAEMPKSEKNDKQRMSVILQPDLLGQSKTEPQAETLCDKSVSLKGINSISRELLSKIFLTYFKRGGSVINLLTVCKHWQQVAEGCPQLWTKVTILPSNNPGHEPTNAIKCSSFEAFLRMETRLQASLCHLYLDSEFNIQWPENFNFPCVESISLLVSGDASTPKTPDYFTTLPNLGSLELISVHTKPPLDQDEDSLKLISTESFFRQLLAENLKKIVIQGSSIATDLFCVRGALSSVKILEFFLTDAQGEHAFSRRRDFPQLNHLKIEFPSEFNSPTSFYIPVGNFQTLELINIPTFEPIPYKEKELEPSVKKRKPSAKERKALSKKVKPNRKFLKKIKPRGKQGKSATRATPQKHIPSGFLFRSEKKQVTLPLLTELAICNNWGVISRINAPELKILKLRITSDKPSSMLYTEIDKPWGEMQLRELEVDLCFDGAALTKLLDKPQLRNLKHLVLVNKKRGEGSTYSDDAALKEPMGELQLQNLGHTILMNEKQGESSALGDDAALTKPLDEIQLQNLEHPVLINEKQKESPALSDDIIKIFMVKDFYPTIKKMEIFFVGPPPEAKLVIKQMEAILDARNSLQLSKADPLIDISARCFKEVERNGEVSNFDGLLRLQNAREQREEEKKEKEKEIREI